ncbi:hypothetical protein BS78_04G103600 [Paspalum vaginatum]|nr:hypothetical protein BS78_04G103600 [Paspalum vaginatum]
MGADGLEVYASAAGAACERAGGHVCRAGHLLPVAVLLLLHRPRSGRAIFFAAFAAFCTTISLILCCRFYAELRRPPWLRRLSAASGGQQQQAEDGSTAAAVGQESTAREVPSHALRHPEQQPVMMPCVETEMKAALARIPCHDYEHPDEDGGAAEGCAVCLGVVGEGEVVRRLPACQHVFHRECIDLWLRAHATCPVCRSGVLSPAPERRAVEVAVDIGAAHEQPRAAGLEYVCFMTKFVMLPSVNFDCV